MNNAYIIKKPVITEKALMLANRDNIYSFEVDRLATKFQIAVAVTELFGVDVLDVHTIKQQRVAKNTGRKRLKTVLAPTKKALVTLKKGQTLDVFNLGGQTK